MKWVWVGLWGLAMLGCMAGRAAAAAAPAVPAAFPADGWHNGGPYHLDDLEGKAVVMVFFDHRQPFIRNQQWPRMLEMSAKHRDKPVLFLAVAPGATPMEVDQYIRDAKLPWPMLCDVTRDFEKRSGLKPLTMSSPIACLIVDPEGKYASVFSKVEKDKDGRDYFSFEDSVADAAGAAKWKVDPAGIPGTLRAAWQAVEWGQFASASPQVKALLRSSDAKVKEAAQKLDAVIVAAADRRLTAAKAAEGAKKPWEAYKLYSLVGRQFPLYDQAKQADAAARKLAGDAVVQKEMRAANLLAAAQRMMASGNQRALTEAKAQLDFIARTMADTEAGARAKELGGL